MTIDEALRELSRVRAIVSPYGQDCIDTVLGEVERLRGLVRKQASPPPSRPTDDDFLCA